MMNRKNLFGGLDDFEDILRKLFGNENFLNEVSSGVDEDGEWTKKTISSEDGTYKSTVYYRAGFGGGASPKKTNNSGNTIKQLKKELDVAVEKEDFQLAIYIRDRIKKLEENSGKIGDLENEMKEAIEKQDFERAIEIRNELNKLKS